MEKAKAEIRRGAKTNGVEISEDLLERIQAPVKEEEKKDVTAQRPSYKDLFVNACIRRRILAMAFSWIAAVLCYNGLVFNSVNIGGSVYVNMALGVVIEVCVGTSDLLTLPSSLSSLISAPLTEAFQIKSN